GVFFMHFADRICSNRYNKRKRKPAAPAGHVPEEEAGSMKRNAPHSDAWNAQAPEREPWQEPDHFSGETPERAGGGSARLVPLVICAILLAVLLVEGVFIWGKSAQMQRNNAVYVP